MKRHYLPTKLLTILMLVVAALTTLSACSAEPRLQIDPEARQDTDKPPILTDVGRRVASPEEYQAILEENTDDKEIRAMLDQLLKVSQDITHDGLITGNAARLLVDGPGTFKAMFEDIDRAQHSIHIETFILEEDEIGQRLAKHLIASRQRGVTVRVLIDALGSLDLSEEYIERLRNQGIEIRKFHPLDPTEDIRIWRTNNRNHRKILIIDGHIAYTGGINFSDVYSEGSFSSSHGAPKADSAWRDTHVRIQGPAVHQFQTCFLELWNKDLDDDNKIHGDEFFPVIQTQGDMVVGVVDSHGGDEEFDIYSVLVAAIGHAQKRVYITQAYFAPDEAFLEVIKTAAKRGVDVQLLLPGVSDAPILVQASRSSYKELLEAGVRIHERTLSTLHAKTVVIDGVWSTIGSANFDYRSFVDNYELNAIIVSDDFGTAMEKLFQVDLQQTEEITLSKWNNRPLWQRVKEKFADVLRPWL